MSKDGRDMYDEYFEGVMSDKSIEKDKQVDENLGVTKNNNYVGEPLSRDNSF